MAVVCKLDEHATENITEVVKIPIAIHIPDGENFLPLVDSFMSFTKIFQNRRSDLDPFSDLKKFAKSLCFLSSLFPL